MAGLEKDVLLTGRLRIRAIRGPGGPPLRGLRVTVRACGFVWGGTSVVTGGDGRAEIDAPIGKATVSVGEVFSEEVWIGEGRVHDLDVLVPERPMPRVPGWWPF